MKAVADVSALLSLEYMGALEDTFDIADIYTSGSVEEELNEIAVFRDEKSGIAKKILTHISDGRIKCIDIKSESSNKNALMGQCFFLCISAKIPVLLTDDADAAYLLGRIAAQKGIKLRMCASVLVELIKAGKISPQAAKGKLEDLIKKRSWEGGILEVLSRRYLEVGEW
ncbi:MAG: hypothetical protein KKG76_08050 [Euryarchaeota archaeon]|nr:hypothetical protein [Euryarchaeota archaeon]MBU4138797.1 hypothetical protein [Euryarchaeota archaeon]